MLAFESGVVTGIYDQKAASARVDDPCRLQLGQHLLGLGQDDLAG